MSRARAGGPGSTTIMKKHNDASERAVALVNQVLDVLQRAAHAPASPVNAFTPAKQRREFRRRAARLRAGKVQLRYRNLHTAEELADILERTVQRDEMLERDGEELKRITREMNTAIEQGGPEVREALVEMLLEAKRSADEHGPGSEAALRFQLMTMVAWLGHRSDTHRRRRRTPGPLSIPLAPDPTVEARYQRTAAELLASAPSPAETVIAIPPEEEGSGRGRIFLRIGIGASSWVGSFERGHECVSTVSMMPDGKHLFVSACGAGYVIDATSRTLVERIGTEVAGTMVDEAMTLFVVDHGGISLEAFGRTGRLWKTVPIGAGRFRRTMLAAGRIVGEAWSPHRPEWVGFSVDLATGEVRFDDAGACGARRGSILPQ